MTAWVLTRVGEEAVPILARLHQDAFAGGEVWNEMAFRALLRMSGCEAWVASDRDEPQGLILVRRCLKESEVLTLGVRPAAQRRGAARALIGPFLQRARQVGEVIFLEVSINNYAALSLYRDCGFRDNGCRPNYYRDGSDACLLIFS